MEPASAAVSAVAQVLLFGLVPFVVYVATRRDTRGFGNYVGLYACPSTALMPAVVAFLVTAPLAVSLYALPTFRAVALADTSTAGIIAEMGAEPATFAVIAVVAFVQTSLAEELLFRGFVAKRLIARFAFQRGNAAQALVFVAPHLLLFAGPAGAELTPAAVVVVAMTSGTLGWFAGWLNERKGDGSIVPGWLVHGAINALSYTAALLI